MPPDTSLAAIVRVIQLAVAPVFLVTGVAAVLSVLTNRLARIIDRTRVLDADLAPTPTIREELDLLVRRGRLVNRAIALTTTSALLISTVIVTLFLGAFLTVNVAIVVGILFVVAMLALIGGLITFLQEVRLATRTMRLPSRQPG